MNVVYEEVKFGKPCDGRNRHNISGRSETNCCCTAVSIGCERKITTVSEIVGHAISFGADLAVDHVEEKVRNRHWKRDGEPNMERPGKNL